jgi:hypothetical protein
VRGDEAGLVGEDDRLRAVAQPPPHIRDIRASAWKVPVLQDAGRPAAGQPGIALAGPALTQVAAETTERGEARVIFTLTLADS